MDFSAGLQDVICTSKNNIDLSQYYKNLSWVWGYDRKIRPENRRLAPRGVPSDDKRWSRGRDFSILPSYE